MSNALEKLGGEVLGLAAAELKDHESDLLALFDAAVTNGETSVEGALTSAIKAKGGVAGALLGGTMSGLIAEAVKDLSVAADGAAKAAFDAVVAAMEAEAAKLET